MTIDFILPDIGEGIVECELLEWLVSEGDVIEEDQPVAEVMTDKATVTIPSPKSGTIEKIYFQEGDVAPVGDLLVVIATAGATSPSKPVAPPAQAAPQTTRSTSTARGTSRAGTAR